MAAGERPFIEVSGGRQAAASARRLPANLRIATLDSCAMADNDIEVTPDETRRRFAAGEVQLIDVREPAETGVSRIPGDDVRLIPLAELTAQASSIDKDKPVVFSCRSGGRSLMAAQAFRASGYEAYSMAGGLLEWSAAGLPVEPPGAPVAEH
jgi:rhodanese-related sulfurtransferase